MRLLIMGPPGAGKGTQAGGVADHYGIPAISSGAIFRHNIENQTPLGLRVSGIIAAGEYVPDDITTDLVLSRLTEPDCGAGWLLDGYPRTTGQVRALDAAMATRGTHLDGVISLQAEPEALIDRLLTRAHLEGRIDDTEETIRRRIDVYHNETEDLLTLYRDRGVLVEVDAIGEVTEVTRRLVEALDAKVGY